MPTSVRNPIAQMAWRVFAATDALGKMTLDEETVELWAHDPKLLDSHLEPIRRDLDAIPVKLKAHGGLAEEAKQCRDAIDELKEAAAGYSFAPASHSCVYLMPPDRVLSPACWAEQTFHEWRTMDIADRKGKGLGVEAIEFCRLSNTYPMDVIAAARKVAVAVRPVMDAFTEAGHGGNAPRLGTNTRFAIALSFPGERRDFVERVASYLAGQVGRDRVLYDKYHEAEFAQPDLDVYLPNLYSTKSELIVIFLCAAYAKKRWCKLEWRSIRQLISTSESQRIMFISFDEIGAVPELGILSGDGYASIGSRSPDEIAALILQRLEVNRQNGGGRTGVTENLGTS